MIINNKKFDFLFESPVLNKEITNINNVFMWIGKPSEKHGFRLKISNNKNKFDIDDCFSISFDFLISGKINKKVISNSKLDEIKNFMLKNKEILVKYMKCELLTDEFLNLINIQNMKKFTMYSGISKESWKNKNLKDKLTNVTSDISFAYDYSYDFNTGSYDDTVIEISNIPINAFISYREDDYEDDDDFINIEKETPENKEYIINNNSLFLVDLFKYKDMIDIKKL
jgi:hypothetical protein